MVNFETFIKLDNLYSMLKFYAADNYVDEEFDDESQVHSDRGMSSAVRNECCCVDNIYFVQLWYCFLLQRI